MQLGVKPIALRTFEIWFEGERAVIDAEGFVKLPKLNINQPTVRECLGEIRL
jgi:hypothetical protein